MTIEAQAARVELLFLRAIMPKEIQIPLEPIHLTEERRHTSLAGAVQYLAQQAKPVRCRGRLESGGLAVAAGPPTQEERQQHEWLLKVPKVDTWQQLNLVAPTGLIRVKGGDESVIVAIEAYEAWWRDYIHTGSVVVAGPSPPPKDSSGDSYWEVRIGRAGPPVESYALDPDETALCERCRQFLAVAVFRDRTSSPPTTSLLCQRCLHAEGARELARNLGISNTMSDEEARQFFDQFLEGMQREFDQDNSDKEVQS